MRSFACVAVGLASVCAFSQGGLSVNGKQVEVGPPTAVAVGVNEVFWKADGQALAFYAKDADGTYLGVFHLAEGKAKDVMRFAEGTQVHFEQWMPNRPHYVIATSRPVPGRALKHWAVTTIDARTMVASEVWSHDYAADAEVGLDFKVSPSLDHALITVTDVDGRHPIVLIDGAMSTLYSRDMAAAWREGMDFSGWSADGTAYFGGAHLRPSNESVFFTGLNKSEASSIVSLQLAQVESKVSESLLTFLFKIAPVAPEAGTPVYELMPRNGSLRPVLSRGPYVGPEVLPHVVWPKDEEAVVRSNERLGGTGAIWLVALTGDEEVPYGSEGVLVSGERGKSWMCEDGNWIAYEVAGALFVKRITYGGGPFSKGLFGGG